MGTRCASVLLGWCPAGGDRVGAGPQRQVHWLTCGEDTDAVDERGLGWSWCPVDELGAAAQVQRVARVSVLGPAPALQGDVV